MKQEEYRNLALSLDWHELPPNGNQYMMSFKNDATPHRIDVYFTTGTVMYGGMSGRHVIRHLKITKEQFEALLTKHL